MLKTCVRCNEEKNLCDFYRNASRSDGYQAYCKRCQNAYRRGLRKRKRDEEGKLVRTKEVVAALITMATCPFCKNKVYHVVKKDPDLGGTLQQLESIRVAIDRLSQGLQPRTHGAPRDPNQRSESDIEEAHFSDV